MQTKYYIDQQGNYYGGDRQNQNDIEVSERPSQYHVWDGSQWVIDTNMETEGNKNGIRAKIIDEMPYFAMLVIHLAQTLISKGVISQADFSATDRAEYQKISTFVNNYLNL